MTDLTIRELLDELSRDPVAQTTFEADPDGYLTAYGFDLPSELIGEAIFNVAATLPVDLAERLSPFTTAHSPISVESSFEDAADDPVDGLALLASASATATVEAEPGRFGLGTGDTESSAADWFEQSPDAELLDASYTVDGPHIADDGAVDPLAAGLADFGLELEDIDLLEVEPGDPAGLDDLDGLD